MVDAKQSPITCANQTGGNFCKCLSPEALIVEAWPITVSVVQIELIRQSSKRLCCSHEWCAAATLWRSY
jgi:hypothetical protein